MCGSARAAASALAMVVFPAPEVPTTAIRTGLLPSAVGASVGGIKRDGLRSPHSNGGAFGERRVCFRRVAARNCSPYCRTIAAAGFSRMPTPPRSSTKAHSAAIRLTTSSAVKIGGISLPWQTCAGFSSQAPVLNLYRSRASSLPGVIPEIDIWRAAQLMLKRYGEKGRGGKRRSSCSHDHQPVDRDREGCRGNRDGQGTAANLRLRPHPLNLNRVLRTAASCRPATTTAGGTGDIA
jgi:hypothetical protein